MKKNTLSNFGLTKPPLRILSRMSKLIALVLVFSSFTGVVDHSPMMNQDTSCTNPLAVSLGYNAFVRYNTKLENGDTDGPVAIGGDLSINGIITIAGQTAGTNFFNGDDQASSLVINGQVFYTSGQGILLNQGYIKIGALEGSSVYDRDSNNAQINTRVTAGAYNARPNIQSQRHQSVSSVAQGDLIDFDAAFMVLENQSEYLSGLEATVNLEENYKVTLEENQVNILRITAQELVALPYMTLENQPSINTPLIIDVDASGDLDWDVFNLNGVGDEHGAYILWNFSNAATISFNGGGTMIGSVLAPKSNVIKASSGNINGQVIAASYTHRNGELHYHVFQSCVTEIPVICELMVTVGEDQTVCEGTAVTLNATASGDLGDCTTGISYLWSTGETTATITVATSGTYTVAIKDCEACIAYDEVVVTVHNGIQVDLGEDRLLCLDQEAVLTAEVSGIANCTTCTEYELFNTNRCVGSQEYVVWINDADGDHWLENVNLVWSEEADGTATLKGNVVDTNDGTAIYVVDVVLTGRSTEILSGGVKEHLCHVEDTTGWEYYEKISGTVATIDGSWSIDVIRRGQAFQVGNGANNTETEVGANGGSGWFIAANDVTIVGDFNFIKGDCITTGVSNAVEYLWSTGETTPSITVTESDTYSVEVTGCGNCEGYDAMVVDFEDVIADAGDDIEVCIPTASTLPASAALTATGGDRYLWSTGETTASITVYTKATTSYTVTVFKGECSDTDDVLVTVVTCEGRNTGLKAAVYPLPQAADQGVITVEVNNTVSEKSRISFELYDVNGKIIDKPASQQIELGKNKLELAIPDLSPGIYLLKMMNTTNAEGGVKRLIIE